jgi:hypothetical protein
VGELGRHGAHLASNCREKRQVPQFGDACDGCEQVVCSLTHGGNFPPP